MYEKILYSLIFVAAAMILSFWQKAGIEKEIGINTFRAFIQLLVVGYFLEYIFGLTNPVYMVLLILAMSGVGALTSYRRAPEIPHAFLISWLFIALGGAFTIGLMLATDILSTKASYLIPMAGIVIGNEVKAASLSLTQTKKELAQNREIIEASLAMGATGRQSIHPIAKSVIRTASIPIIETFKIVGLIQMPGIMTGMLLAGSPPLEAVTYQLIVLYTILISVIITSFGVTFLSLREYFTKDHQLIQQLVE